MTWRKSGHSGAESNCVELNGTLDAVRDSKNPSGPTLSVPALRAFVRAAKSGRFDR
jgi:hypothetical protein